MAVQVHIAENALTRLIDFSRQALRFGTDVNAVIVGVFIARNGPLGVTGLLLVHDGWFLQALEGSADAVRATYDRSGADRRHCEVTRIALAPTQIRCFADWGMCAHQLSPTDGAMKVLSDKGPFNPARLGVDDALRLLRTVHAIRTRSRKPGQSTNERASRP
jgi:hypothetical protein